ncbi:MAG: hypothetical protein ACI37Z_10260 [Candidatus Gastranaerophilaceae bacterium]
MNISNLLQTKSLTPLKQVKQRDLYRKTSTPNDVFSKTNAAKKEEKPAFNADKAIEELKEVKSFNGKTKFTDKKAEELKSILVEAPEKWDAVKILANQPKMISSLVLEFANKDLETLNAVKDLSLMKKESGDAKFSPLQIKKLANDLEGKELAKVPLLATTPLDSDNIYDIAKNPNITDVKKITDIINNFAANSEDARRISFAKDDFDEKAYTIRADFEGNGSKILLLDKNLKERAVETVKMERSKEGYLQQVKNTVDYQNHTTSQVISYTNKNLPAPVVTEETKIVKNAQGQTLRKEVYTLSDLAGTPNIKYIYPDGSEKIVCSGKFDENTGKTTVQKDMTSLDGTRTQYYYEDDPNGNMSSVYKITDKNGNILLDKNITFTVEDENTFISTENDKKYEIKFSDDKIAVKNLANGKVESLNIGQIEGSKEQLLTAFKHMPAEEIIALSKTTDNLTGIDNIYQSTYAATTRTIKSGDNLFTVLHEAGHAKDYANVNVKDKATLVNSIFSKPEVNKVFEEEKAAFNKAFPLAQRDHISYFIKNSEHKDGLQEAIAETNALLNTRNTEDLFTIRSNYLQQYFPKTIALLAQIMD